MDEMTELLDLVHQNEFTRAAMLLGSLPKDILQDMDSDLEIFRDMVHTAIRECDK